MNRFITCNKGATGNADDWPTKKFNAPRIANVGLILAGLAAGPMVGEHDVAGSFADGRILTLVFVALIVFVSGFLSILMRQPMHRPTIDAPLFEFGEFVQQSFMSGLILCAMALGAIGYTLVTGGGQGWRLFAAIAAGCLLGSFASSWLFASRGAVER
ncbi:hypothetical protein [Stenotrophomonas lactitubi]|uniref:hypothetical protein n=1 Tax=Stenotrophomonas lactitubi TaxID=2045214 RepID=UPI001E2F4962|nr:hypothetical protein [Stenotrophomonas lactitubi]